MLIADQARGLAQPSPPNQIAFRPVRRATIASVASAVPGGVVPNAVIAERLGIDDQWIVQRTGVRERRFASPEERLEDIAAEAGRRALAQAGVPATAVDLVLVATITADEVTPSTAPLVAERIGALGAGAIDVSAACTGFVSALSLATAQIEAGRAEHVLVIGADLLSRVLDHEDRKTAALFGDGAGAAVVSRSASGMGAIGPAILRSDGSGRSKIVIHHDERLIRMQGLETFKAAVTNLSAVTLEIAERASVDLEEIGLFVYHQANGRIVSAVADRLGLEQDKVVDCIERYGNTSSASIPIALTEAHAAGRLERGDLVLLAAVGAGLVWGGVMLEWH